MKTLIVYDSAYGNTEKIAKSISGGIAADDEVRVVHVSKASPAEVPGVELLIVGSPTQGGRPTLAIQDFIKGLSEPAVKEMRVAASDTRVAAKWVRIFGYAAGRISGSLKRKGGTMTVAPEGFFVEGKEGPLKEGELERDAAWAKGIIENQQALSRR